MKLRILRVLLVSLLVSSMTLPLFACDGGKTPDESTVESTTESVNTTTEVTTEEVTEEVTEIPMPTEVSLPEGYTNPDITYNCQDDSVLYTYAGKTEENFNAVLDGYKAQGFRVYSDVTKNGSRFTTLVGDGPMAHIYWLKNSGELNIVLSATASATLPPVTPEVTTGDTPVSVTQMQDKTHVNGMGYIIQLADGSFIVYDGAYSDQARRLVSVLEDMVPAGQVPVIRAWVMTHSHDDHHPTFATVARRMSTKVKVERVLFAPIDPESAVAHGGDTYFNEGIHEDIAKLGATAVYVHTGMEFTFCNLKMEILMTSDDVYKTGNHNNYFNNSSTVSRLYDENYSALFTGDCGKESSNLMEEIYGDYLKSDMCQISHHGVEDVPLSFYEAVQASILYYPCSQWLYDQPDRHLDVRQGCEKLPTTKEILIAGLGQYTRAWGTTFDASAPLVVVDHPTWTPQS